MAIDNLLEQIKRGKEQQAITGNPDRNRGDNEALYGAYFDADVKQKSIQRQQDIQQNQFNQTLDFNKDVQKTQENQWAVGQKNAKDAARTQAIGGLVGSGVSAYMGLKGLDNQKQLYDILGGQKGQQAFQPSDLTQTARLENASLDEQLNLETPKQSAFDFGFKGVTDATSYVSNTVGNLIKSLWEMV